MFLLVDFIFYDNLHLFYNDRFAFDSCVTRITEQRWFCILNITSWQFVAFSDNCVKCTPTNVYLFGRTKFIFTIIFTFCLSLSIGTVAFITHHGSSCGNLLTFLITNFWTASKVCTVNQNLLGTLWKVFEFL